ncbi:four helix bundle protein [Kaistella jeonii]|uniref:30S ribosomal protein S23 n=1 Tax=Kaistella jeonii TaxID=266749 RepID=A0A0C1D5K3_9FLAO|nr:four helix bundle protein [Kaistella jeonii]KIA89025.1 30S ribosomal protein S23 [Kaistella jeonii]SFB96285.1 four helix bundle protein [Kaistella jeonii]VEI97177.1 four helix bundle protein [Kaistella jeonii]
MFLNLNHYNLEVYKEAKKFWKACYQLILKLPASEKYNLIDQIRRASTSVLLNLSEGSSRKSQFERNRYYEISRGSIIEIVSCLDIIFEENWLTMEELEQVGKPLKTTFILLSKLINAGKL